MLRIKINGTEYSLPIFASDITLAKFIDLVDLEATQMPKELQQVIDETDPEQRKFKAARMPKRVYARKVIPYYAKAISAVSGIPVETLLGTKKSEGAPVALLETWYWQIMTSLAQFKSSPDKTSWTIDGATWTLPEAEMKRSTFGEFAEAAQYEDYQADVASGNWSSFPKVMAILLKPEGEAYDPYKYGDDDFIEERAKIMLRQTMDLVYQVSFFLLKRSEQLRLNSLIYTIARRLGISRLAATS